MAIISGWRPSYGAEPWYVSNGPALTLSRPVPVISIAPIRRDIAFRGYEISTLAKVIEVGVGDSVNSRRWGINGRWYVTPICTKRASCGLTSGYSVIVLYGLLVLFSTVWKLRSSNGKLEVNERNDYWDLFRLSVENVRIGLE